MHNLPERDFDAARPFSKLGTDVTEFKVAGSKAYLAPVYDMASKEIGGLGREPQSDLGQQKRLPAMLAERLPAGAEPILHSDMDGSTGTNGGGRSSNAPASAGP